MVRLVARWPADEPGASPVKPREAVRSVLRGEPPPRPLFIPLVYALASRLEGGALPGLLGNPTKLANALLQFHRLLRTDGVVGHFDSGAEAEALGARLGWSSYPPRAAAKPFSSVGDFEERAKDAFHRGRLATGLEVTRRLRAMLGDDAALLAGLPGPVALLSQLAVASPGEERWLGAASRWLLALASEFCMAGADIILFRELGLAASLPAWSGAVAPVLKTVRFHDALPAVWVPGAASLRERGLECLPLLSTEDLDRGESLPAPFGLCLGSGLFENGEPRPGLPWQDASRRGCVLVTSSGEIAPTAEMGRVREAVGLVSTLLGRGGG